MEGEWQPAPDIYKSWLAATLIIIHLLVTGCGIWGYMRSAESSIAFTILTGIFVPLSTILLIITVAIILT